MQYEIKKTCSILLGPISQLIRKKIKIIMICLHAQCKQKHTKILQNRTCWPK